MDEKPDPFIGATVGNLVLVAKLGSGGMGTVYRGEHRALKTPYAVKVLHQQFSESPATVERFRREAVACSQLRHENVVFVTDFGVQEGLGIYIVMEYLEGDSLKQVYRQSGRIPIGRLGRVAEQICDAMAAAHRLDIVHRDLKPDNIVVLRDPLRRDFIKVLDFGIAHIKGAGDDDLSASGVTVGTPAYIAPEQVVGKADAIGPAADIYSLGVILFEMLSGGLPFARGANEYDLLSAHVTQPAPPVSSRYPALAGTRLEALIASMLEKKPGRRPTSMIEVKGRLHEAIRELRDRGDPDAFYGVEDAGAPVSLPLQPSVPTPTPDHATSPSLHITSLVRRIKQDAPDSPAAALLSALPNADRLGGEAIALALWGVLQQELLDAPVESERFKQAIKHFGLLMEAVVLAHGGSSPTESQQKVFRSLKNLLTLAPRERQHYLLDAIQNLVHHPLFPKDLLPKEDKGGWQALRSVMHREIRLFGDGPKPPAPAKTAPATGPRPGGPPADPAFRAMYDKGMAYYLDEKFEDAIRELKAAYFIRPYAPILFTIGGAYRALGQPAEALEHFEKYQQAEPNLRPDVRAKLENFIAEAKAQLGHRAEPTPGPAAEVGSDGPVLVLESDSEIKGPSAESRPAARPPVSVPTPPPRQAPAQVTPPPPATPTPPTEGTFESHYERGTALAKSEQYEEAIKEFAAAYRIEPDPALLFHIAWSYRTLGRHREALYFFQRYQQEAPDLRPEARSRLAALIAEAQQQLQAGSAQRAPQAQAATPAQRSPPAQAATPAQRTPPAQPSAPDQAPTAGPGGLPPGAVEPPAPAGTYAEHHARAVSHHKAGRYEDAIREFLAAYQVRPVAALLFNIGATYRLLRRPHAALYYFERFGEAEQDMAESMQIKLSNLKAEARTQIEAEEGRASPFFAK